MFEMLNHQLNIRSWVFTELLMAHSSVLHLSASPCALYVRLKPARITEKRDATAEMVYGAGLENEFVGVQYA